MKKEFINVSWGPEPKPLDVSDAVKVGDTIYARGITGRDEQWRIVEGFEAQAVKAFENLKRVLEESGASFKDVVRLTFYLTNADDFPKLREIRKRYITSPPFPAMTGLQVAGLASPQLFLEIDAVAVVD